MKTVLSFVFSMFLFFSVQSQDDANKYFDNINGGTFYLNAASNFQISFSDGSPTLLGLRGGYFIIDRLALGAGLQLFGFDGDFDTTFDFHSRYYVLDQAFLRASYFDNSGGFFALGVGGKFNLTNKLALEPIFTYPFEDFLDPNISMGFTVFFN